MFLQDMLHLVFPMTFNPLFKELRMKSSSIRNMCNSYYEFYSTANQPPF